MEGIILDPLPIDGPDEGFKKNLPTVIFPTMANRPTISTPHFLVSILNTSGYSSHFSYFNCSLLRKSANMWYIPLMWTAKKLNKWVSAQPLVDWAMP